MHCDPNYLLSLDDGIKEAQELEAYQKEVKRANNLAAKKAASKKTVPGSGSKEEK